MIMFQMKFFYRFWRKNVNEKIIRLSALWLASAADGIKQVKLLRFPVSICPVCVAWFFTLVERVAKKLRCSSKLVFGVRCLKFMFIMVFPLWIFYVWIFFFWKLMCFQLWAPTPWSTFNNCLEIKKKKTQMKNLGTTNKQHQITYTFWLLSSENLDGLTKFCFRYLQLLIHSH